MCADLALWVFVAESTLQFFIFMDESVTKKGSNLYMVLLLTPSPHDWSLKSTIVHLFVYVRSCC